MTSNISQKEYLKKYLNKSSKDKKKLKARKKSKNIKIIDDDNVPNTKMEDESIDLYGEDAPQIVGIIDERGADIQDLEKYKDNYRWKVIDKCEDDDTVSKETKTVDNANQNVKNDMPISKETKIGEGDPKQNMNSCGGKPVERKTESSENRGKRKDDDSSRRNEVDMRTNKFRKIKWNAANNKQQREDLSPPRRKHNNGRENDKSGRGQNDNDLSPPRKRENSSRKDSDENNKEDRRKHNKCDDDISPPRKKQSSSHRDVHEDDDDRMKNEGDKGVRRKYEDRYPPRKRNLSRGRDRHDHRAYKNDRDHSSRQHRDVPRKDTRRNDVGERRRSYECRNDALELPSKKPRTRSSGRYGRTRRLSDREEITLSSLEKRSHSTRNDGSRIDRDRIDRDRIGRDRIGRDRIGRDRIGRDRIGRDRIDRDRIDRDRIDRDRIDRDSYPRPIDYLEDEETLFELVNERRLTDTVPLPAMRNVTDPVFLDRSRFVDDHDPRHLDPMEAINRNINRVLNYKKPGLQDARHVRMEAEELLKLETIYLERLNADVSGRDAAPIMRDRKTGRHRNTEEESKLNLQKRRRAEERDEKFYKWGRGLKQIEDAREKYTSDLHEMSKPLARYADDVDLERHLKARERIGDPMLNYVRSKRTDRYDEVDSGRGIKPQYRGSYLPNRFNIPPGHRWDGVDRSNGYEKKWFEKESRRRAIEEEAYKWSTADM